MVTTIVGTVQWPSVFNTAANDLAFSHATSVFVHGWEQCTAIANSCCLKFWRRYIYLVRIL